VRDAFASQQSKASQQAGRRDVGWRRQLLLASFALLVAFVAFAFLQRPVASALALLVGIVGFGAAHNVPRRPSRQDHQTGGALMAAAGRERMDRPAGFQAEVDLAYLVQQVVFDVAPFEKRNSDGRKVALPTGSRRELSDLAATRNGQCFDRSRAIEMLLRLHGLKVRHVSIFAIRDGYTPLGALLNRSSPSHSLSEVKTERGWMTIDSNFRFVGLTAGGDAMSARDLARLPEVEWDERNREIPPKITAPFVATYGLYSRHGRFYPPYSRFPNINWLELTYNFGW
jgi:hypothetical protein